MRVDALPRTRALRLIVETIIVACVLFFLARWLLTVDELADVAAAGIWMIAFAVAAASALWRQRIERSRP